MITDSTTFYSTEILFLQRPKYWKLKTLKNLLTLFYCSLYLGILLLYLDTSLVTKHVIYLLLTKIKKNTEIKFKKLKLKYIFRYTKTNRNLLFLSHSILLSWRQVVISIKAYNFRHNPLTDRIYILSLEQGIQVEYIGNIISLLRLYKSRITHSFDISSWVNHLNSHEISIYWKISIITKDQKNWKIYLKHKIKINKIPYIYMCIISIKT